MVKPNTRKRRKTLFVYLVFAIILLLSIIPAKLVIATYQSPNPQAILVLGGDGDREKFAAEFAQNHPQLPIWVSSGLFPEKSQSIFQAADISSDRLNIDRRASDTVTNFTTLVDTFKNNHIQHIYLITSDYHLPRARAIAFFVLGSQGITFTPVGVPGKPITEESIWRTLRDCGRSILWIVTGRTGASLKDLVASLPSTLLQL